MPLAQLGTRMSMYYEEHGSGEPVVLLYGAGGDHTPWEPQVDALSARFRLITPDNRGAGKSDLHAETWTVRTLAEDTVALLDVLGIERTHIGGMSLGSAICQEIAINWPERVKSAVLINTWGRTDARLRLFWEHLTFLNHQAELAAEHDSTAVGQWQENIKNLVLWAVFSPDALENRRDMIARWWNAYSAGSSPEGSAGHLKAAMRHDALDRLSAIRAPTLVLAGEEDYFTRSYPREVHERIPDCRLELLTGPGSSHMLLWERSTDANEILTDFLVANTD